MSEKKEVLAFVVDEKHEWLVQLREAYRVTAAIEEGKYTQKLAKEVNRNVAHLWKFKQWLDGLGFRSAFTAPEDLGWKVESALREWCDRHPKFATVVAPELAAPVDPRRYLTYWRGQTAWIDIRGLQVGTGQVYRFPIEDLYIPPTTTGGAEEMEKRARSGRSSPFLEDALKHGRLVIVGDPGAGKSTFLRRIAFSLCRAALGESPRDGLGLVTKQAS